MFQVISEKHTLNDEYENFFTHRMEATVEPNAVPCYINHPYSIQENPINTNAQKLWKSQKELINTYKKEQLKSILVQLDNI